MNWYTSGAVPSEIDWDRDLVVHLPAALGRKQTLLRALRTGLTLPGYFGENWDALEECLRDLWWLPDEQRVWLIHADTPFSAASANRQVYLAILREAVTHWQSSGQTGRLRVHFPGPI
jgi:hypothetical protein